MSLVPILIILLAICILASALTIRGDKSRSSIREEELEHFDGGTMTPADTIDISAAPASRAARDTGEGSSDPPPSPERFHDEPSRSVLAEYGMEYVPPTVWSTPQYRPPTCHQRTACRDCPGTTTAQFATLHEATHDTSVGSILPRFEFRESAR